MLAFSQKFVFAKYPVLMGTTTVQVCILIECGKVTLEKISKIAQIVYFTRFSGM